ncbi:ABC sugar transporter inner membrane binding protein [Pseudovibrio sp. FO-BEG1]|uniref:Carbohydrate ABC transporter membrane protein 2, CUT1 family n=1 Tax=Pseudovibrio denitrificans TaxID=258256 RepID=A0A1I7DA23_9HYPH|nr:MULTISPECIES: carbohydrate ABC transporter permease [Pseudovibrio]AEV36469.1 ABC sugar transporter inner membrane binding protein [Pseudovibrio sp. FO-BEG1]EEA94565.1 binding-protein-dependent transport system inner membrane component [Pseudovibrio sp. JE062]SFU08477.1 carbohydrate ABC transporter membrane protein 2, CUT1 family [Pseudovibrio denitrificans]
MADTATLGSTSGDYVAPKRFNPWPVVIFICLFTLAILFLAPTFGVLLSSVKTTRDIALGDLWAIPSSMYWGNYVEVLSNPAVHGYMLNTFLVAAPATAFSIALGVLAGYVFAKLPFKGSDLVFLLVVSGMFFPPQVILIPLFRLFNLMGLIDTLWPMIIVHTALGIPICTLLMRNFFATVPNPLREAAILEGASEWQVLTKIALPISLPAIAVLATLQFTWIWNDFLWPLIFTQSDEKRTIMLGLVFMKGQYSVAWGIQGAMSLIASLPTLIVFLFFQRYFIKGMTMGAVKG